MWAWANKRVQSLRCWPKLEPELPQVYRTYWTESNYLASSLNFWGIRIDTASRSSSSQAFRSRRFRGKVIVIATLNLLSGLKNRYWSERNILRVLLNFITSFHCFASTRHGLWAAWSSVSVTNVLFTVCPKWNLLSSAGLWRWGPELNFDSFALSARVL